MTTTIKKEENKLTAYLSGRLDTAAAVKTAEDIQPLLEVSNTEIVLDCTDLEYISSSGLRIFLTIRKDAATKSNKVIVKNINADIRQVFIMTGFVSLFDIQ